MALRNDLVAAMETYCNSLDTATTLLIHDIDEAVDKVLAYDELITNLSNSFNVRKAPSSLNPFWEYWKMTYEDTIVSDTAVRLWYNYLTQEEAWRRSGDHSPADPTPMPENPDCSTGVSQIFAWASMRAKNWARNNGLHRGAPMDPGNWHEMWAEWPRLNEDDNYNISTVPLMLFEGGARRAGITGQRLTYTDGEMQSMLASYQGDGDLSITYGKKRHRRLPGLRAVQRHRAATLTEQSHRPMKARTGSWSTGVGRLTRNRPSWMTLSKCEAVNDRAGDREPHAPPSEFVLGLAGLGQPGHRPVRDRADRSPRYPHLLPSRDQWPRRRRAVRP